MNVTAEILIFGKHLTPRKTSMPEPAEVNAVPIGRNDLRATEYGLRLSPFYSKQSGAPKI